ncbi:hypothetical protein SADUNF_Sadunf13G0022100 [Salix dunnii]|uniref:Uncharacterized protein n=1 Tax=Salix dunnii TaxID=1413687 RepID=A0A835JF05_9ROSI|nr:hypothetical protein SADUNF_Sadunf13G0022100 [Salix dunnii]
MSAMFLTRNLQPEDIRTDFWFVLIIVSKLAPQNLRLRRKGILSENGGSENFPLFSESMKLKI